MSTRTRLVMLYKGEVYASGAAAVRELLFRSRAPAMPIIGLNKREKLLRLANDLPPQFTLVLIQEPRRTRKNRSLYWELKRQKDKQVNQPQNPVLQRQAIPYEGLDDLGEGGVD